ncbi:kinase domain-containing protein [Aspergillus homomorphus CBS 101889]|uniref:non-specific serine/threonine protein kinase n=1 Tax=Aspergillus homomorphus (strain CBS 101889) TaxID=1450537 RepID=A0A395HMJ0_ASPHC|nr:kinase domain-containing protein [Aspergillus homomorphus CBS 101889]RAL08078.1 kinase domain-containing protein [Aspergillus homomorphus CBS 101889]
MESSKVKYKFIEGYERVGYYVPGGYHLVSLVVDKLRFGRNATTWLAEDTRKHCLVALKISTAESAHRTRELELLMRLRETKSSHMGSGLVQILQDAFIISCPNGTHQCLVSSFERISLNGVNELPFHRLLPLPAARAIAAQLVLGLHFIHSEGIVHGDLHAGNILLQLPPDMQNISLKQLRRQKGEPMKEPVVREDGAPLDPGVPPEVIMPMWLGIESDKVTLADAQIKTSDFGEAFDPRISKQYSAHTPLVVAPPESRFAEDSNEPLSFPSDIWTLACTIWDVFGCRPPFETFEGSLDEMTVEHVETLGKLPQRWWDLWEGRNRWFDEGRKNVTEDLQQRYGTLLWGWDNRFAEYIQLSREKQGLGPLPPDEETAFQQMMKMMLVLEPGERATISKVLGCEWMQQWGLPEWR